MSTIIYVYILPHVPLIMPEVLYLMAFHRYKEKYCWLSVNRCKKKINKKNCEERVLSRLSFLKFSIEKFKALS